MVLRCKKKTNLLSDKYILNVAIDSCYFCPVMVKFKIVLSVNEYIVLNGRKPLVFLQAALSVLRNQC